MADLTQEELLRDLHTRFNRVERAILGDPSVGHRGLVTRVEHLENAKERAPEIHQGIEKNRIAGDRRLHDRITEVEEETRQATLRIEKKIDRILFVFAGAFLGGLGTGGGLVWAILGG